MMSRLIIEETSVYELDEECMRRKTAERMREKKNSKPCTKEFKKAKQGMQDGQTLTQTVQKNPGIPEGIPGLTLLQTLAAAAVSAEETVVSAASAAAGQQKNDPQAAIVSAAVSAEEGTVSVSAAGREKKEPDQGIAAAIVAGIGAAASTVCRS